MEPKTIHLLDQYIIGKDQDKYQILETIYDSEAELDFEINSNAITFPSKVVGNIAIAKTLSADFNKKYEKVKTYYLSLNISKKDSIQKQPWLVVMKEKGADLTRIGTGYYNWKFIGSNNNLKIINHKIYIHSMLEIHDAKSEQLKEIQKNLEYPWTQKSVVVNILNRYENLTDITDYLMK